jgi:hypothetical protein
MRGNNMKNTAMKRNLKIQAQRKGKRVGVRQRSFSSMGGHQHVYS